MILNYSKLSKLLKVIWFIGIVISSIIFIGSGYFAVCSFLGFDLKIPSVSFQVNNYSYRLNTKYLAIYNLDEALKENIEYELGDLVIYQSWKQPILESLYHLPSMPLIPDSLKEPLKSSRIRVKYHYGFPSRVSGFSKLSDEPEFIISGFLIITSFLFFGLLIIFNVRKILVPDNPSKIFSEGNSDSIKFIGIYIILSEVVRNLLFFWMNSSVIKSIHHSFFENNNISTIIQNYSFSLSDINYGLIFVGVITLVLSEVFRIGAKLKEDVDLAI